LQLSTPPIWNLKKAGKTRHCISNDMGLYFKNCLLLLFFSPS
jgi:hypothetical protein